MVDRESAKKNHEKAVTRQLLELVNARVSFQRFGDPVNREPDVIYTCGGKTLGIEVSTAYYRNRDAQDEWEIATGERPLAAGEIRPSSGGIIRNPDHGFARIYLTYTAPEHEGGSYTAIRIL